MHNHDNNVITDDTELTALYYSWLVVAVVVLVVVLQMMDNLLSLAMSLSLKMECSPFGMA